MSFWGAEVKPGKPYTLADSASSGRLRLTRATLGAEVGKGEKGGGSCGKAGVVQVQCIVDNKDPVLLCALMPGQSETCHMDLEFEEELATFSVLGSRSVHLAGYYVRDVYAEDMGDSDTGSDSTQCSDDEPFTDLCEMSTDSEDDSSEYDSEADEVGMMYNQCKGKSSVVIEEIQEGDKPAVVGEGQKGSNKKQSIENSDKSQLLLAVRAPPAESLETEDEDGLPVSFSEAKKSFEGNSKKNKNLNSETSNEDRKRKNSAITDHHDSSGEVKSENDGMSKKKKSANAKKAVVDNKEKESKQQDSPVGHVDAKKKKKKNKNTSASEAVTSRQIDMETYIDNDSEAVPAHETKKKKTGKISENQASQDFKGSESKKEPIQTRTFGNGLIIQAVAMGKPDGKKASPGKTVFVQYIGKLKNGTIFDSTVGKRPLKFRLGVGEVIQGWDVGINGMRVGDKRRLIIPPSMGYGNQRMGRMIPANSTLVFDVELVNVK